MAKKNIFNNNSKTGSLGAKVINGNKKAGKIQGAGSLGTRLSDNAKGRSETALERMQQALKKNTTTSRQNSMPVYNFEPDAARNVTRSIATKPVSTGAIGMTSKYENPGVDAVGSMKAMSAAQPVNVPATATAARPSVQVSGLDRIMQNVFGRNVREEQRQAEEEQRKASEENRRKQLNPTQAKLMDAELGYGKTALPGYNTPGYRRPEQNDNPLEPNVPDSMKNAAPYDPKTYQEYMKKANGDPNLAAYLLWSDSNPNSGTWQEGKKLTTEGLMAQEQWNQNGLSHGWLQGDTDPEKKDKLNGYNAMTYGLQHKPVEGRVTAGMDFTGNRTVLTGGTAADKSYWYMTHQWQKEKKTPTLKDLMDPEYMSKTNTDVEGFAESQPEYFMMDRERETATLLYENNMMDAFNGYMDILKMDLNRRKTQYDTGTVTELAHDPVFGGLATVASLGTNVVGSLKTMVGSVAALFGNKDAQDPNSKWYDLQRFTNAARAARGDVWGNTFANVLGDTELAHKAGEFLYGVGASIADNLVAMGISSPLGMGSNAGKIAIQSVMSVEASGSKFLEELDKGRSPVEAFISGIASGAVEAATEKWSIDAFFDKKACASNVQYILRQMLTEGSEEGASTIGGWIVDGLTSWAFGHETEFRTAVNERMAQLQAENPDMSPEDAEDRAVRETIGQFAGQIGQDMLAGALSGGFMAGGSAALNPVQGLNNQALQARADSIRTQMHQTLDQASQMEGASPEFIQQVQSYQQQLQKQGNLGRQGTLNVAQMLMEEEGRIAQENARKESEKAIADAIVRRNAGTTLNEEKVNAAAAAANALANGEKLTAEQQDVLKNVYGAREIAQTMINARQESEKAMKPARRGSRAEAEAMGAAINDRSNGRGYDGGAAHLVTAAYSMPENTKSHKIAARVKNGGNMSNYAAGKLAQQLMRDVNQTGRKTVRTSVQAIIENELRAADPNMTSDQVAHHAETITKGVLEGITKLTEQEKQEITQDQGAFAVFESFVNGNNEHVNWDLDQNLDDRQEVKKRQAEWAHYATVEGKMQELVSEPARAAMKAMSEAFGPDGDGVNRLHRQNLKHNLWAADEKTAKGEKATSGNVVVKGYNAAITDVVTDENGNVSFVVTNSEGKTRKTQASEIRTNNEAMQTVISMTELEPGKLSAAMYKTVLDQVAKSGVQTKDEALDLIRDAAAMYDAAFAESAEPDLKKMTVPEEQARAIWNEAMAAAENAEKERLANIGRVKRTGKGRITYDDSVDVDSLSGEQMEQVRTLEKIGQAIGYDFELYDGSNLDLGSYNVKTGAIRLDVTQNENGRSSILVAAGHELTHFIEHNSAEKYAALRKYVVSSLQDKGVDFDALVQEKLDREAPGSLTYDGAVAEVIADSCQQILGDSKAIEALAKKNRTLAENIRDWLKDFAEKIRKAFDGLQQRTAESQLLMEMGHYAEDMVKLWDDALMEAVDNTSGVTVTMSDALPAEAQLQPSTEEMLHGERPAVIEMPKQEVQSSVRTYRGEGDIRFKNGSFLKETNRDKKATLMNGRDVLEYTLRKNGYDAEQIEQRLTFMDEIADKMEEWGVKYKFLNLDKINQATLVKGRDGKYSMTCVVKNAEYPINIDFSTICDKRADMTRLFDELARMDGKKNGMSALQEIDLSPTNIRRINQILKEAGYETACFGCFVEAKRFDMQKFASEFCDMWNNIVDAVAAENGIKVQQSFNFAKGQSLTAGELDELERSLNNYNHGSKKKGNYVDRGGNVEKKIRTLVEQSVKESGKDGKPYLKYLSAQDLITAEGIANMDKGADEMRKIFNSHWGQKRPKNIHAYVPYHSEIATFSMTRDTVARKLATEEMTKQYVRPVLDENGEQALDKEGEPKFKVDTNAIIKELYGTENPSGIKTEQMLLDYIKKIGGVRNQSFSDYVPTQLYDALQMLADCEARGFNGQCYTKNAYRAWLMGMCGFKTNLSVMFLIDKNVDPAYAGLAAGDADTGLRANMNGDGYLVADYAHVSQDPNWRSDPAKQVQSIGYADATKISTSKLHAASCGAIGVGHSYWHMVAMMNDYYIPYIIGYHRSGMQMEVAETANLNRSADYTNVQNNKKMPDSFKVVKNWQSFNAPSYATWSMDERVAKKELDNYTGTETPASFIQQRYEETGSYVQAMKDMLAFMQENHLTLADSKNAGAGHGDFDLYADLESTQNPRQTADNFISWCLENNQLPLFYEFADNPYYFKNLPDFSVLNLAEMDPEQWAAGAYEDGEGLVYSPQKPVDMSALLTQEGHDLFMNKAVGMMERENAEQEELFGSEEQPSEKKVKTLERIVNDPQLHGRAITRSKNGRITINNAAEVQHSTRDTFTPEQTKYAQYNDAQTEVGGKLKTLKGSAISRSSKGVGKLIGGEYYVHKDYVQDIVPEETMSIAEDTLEKEYPDFDYNCIKYNPKTGVVTFQEAPDFDTAREPIPGNYIAVDTNNGTTRKGYSDYIWHHKWEWVKNDYKGFDVGESWEWSKQWLSVIRETDDPVSNRGVANGSGHGTANWDKQLDYFGLPRDQGSTGTRPKEGQKTQYSTRSVPAVQTSNPDIWQPGHTEQWFRDNGYPIYEDVPLEQQETKRDNSKKGHGTQIASTKSTYEKLFNRLKANNPDGWAGMRVLDASSGLGLGTQEGRNQGFDVTDVEPFPPKTYKPMYIDYSQLQDDVESGKIEPFDYIISNAVLNVVPQDTRDNLVAAMGSVLKPGGQLFVNVISKDYQGAMNSDPDLEGNKKIRKGSARTMEGDYSKKGNASGRGHETFVWGSNSVQKVFSKPELIGYLQDALGDEFEVHGDSFGMTGAIVTRKGGEEQHSMRQDTAIDVRTYIASLDPDDVENEANAAALRQYQKLQFELQKMEAQRDKLSQKIQHSEIGVAETLRRDLLQVENRIKGQRAKIAKFEKEGTFAATMRQVEQFAQTVVAKGSERAVAEMKDSQKRQLEQVLGKKYALKLRLAESAMRERVAQDRKNYWTRDENLKIQKGIQRMVKDVKKLRLHETDYKNIPEGYKPLADALVNIFVDSDQKGGDLIWSKDVARDLASKYELLGFSEDTELSYSDDVLEALRDAEAAMEEYGDAKRTIGMSVSERMQSRNALLKRINTAVESVYSILKAQGQSFINGKAMDTAEAAAPVIGDADRRADYKEFTGKLGTIVGTLDKRIRRGNMTPEYFFRSLRNSGLTDINEGFHTGEADYGTGMMEAKQKIDEVRAKHGWQNWGDKHLKFKSAQGRQLDLTIQQAMSLYATWKREHQTGLIVSQHLENGGFVVDDSAIRQQGLFGRQSMKTSGNVITDGDMKKITDWLTDEQKAYADEMVAYLSGPMGEKGNEASMRLYGIRKYGEKYYFPIRSYQGNMYIRSDAGTTNATSDARVKHASFTNSRLNNARNAVLLEDFDTVVANHINQMLVYSNLVVPIESFNRVLNHKLESTDGSEMTVRSLISQKYGKNVSEYMQQYLKDLNGGPSTDPRKTWLDKLLSTFKKSAVAGSLSVSLQQPLSYIRAAMEISPKYLTKAMATGYKGSYAEMMKYSGVAVIKDMGKFDVGYGKGAVDWLTGEDPNRSGAQKAMDTASEYATILPEKMDQATWTRMWQAVKLEQMDELPDMDHTSAEFLQRVGTRFNEVMRLTQVYDSVMVRSNNMRSQDYGNKVMTSFMAEPTLTANMLYDAYSRLNERGGKKRVAKATTVFLTSAIAQAAIKGLMSAWRTPDEKKTLEEQFVTRAMQNFVSEANPLGLIPGASDLLDALSGSDIDDSAWSVITQLSGAVDKFAKGMTGEATVGYKWFEDTAGLVAQIFTSVPARNLMRDMRAMYNALTRTGQADRMTSDAVLKYSAMEGALKSDMIGLVNDFLVNAGAGVDTSTTGYYKQIYDASKRGDAGTAEELREYLTLGKGTNADTINTGVKKLVKADEDMTVDEKVQYLVDEGMADDEKDAFSYAGGGYQGLYDSVEGNRAADIKAAVQTMTKYGYQPKDVIKQLTSKYKAAYLEASGQEKIRMKDALTKAYVACGMTEADAIKKINDWKKE